MMNQKTPFPQRVRNELRFREITVLKSERVSGFQRIVFGGDALAGFSSRGFDDHIKVFFPQDGAPFVPPEVTDEGIVWAGDVRPPSRDYTPLFDEASQQLTIDFYVHEAGVASDWAVAAKPGDTLCIGGPRGSLVVPEDYAWQLYVCDESGMPALRRRLEALRAQAKPVQVEAIVTVADEALKGYLAHLGEFNIQWVIGHDAQAVEAKLAALTVPEDDYYLWITGEGKVVKRLSEPFEGRVDPQLMRAAAYWHSK
ncbi:siderophore-interacting protein [Cronobacter sakazakii]|uniref:siderophore-interacting protein n=1 Tax=Cronobacter sakazakii TaxID=28141 RepID=UPI000B4B57B6|nr:siderophore-interacting protein [Cronobacter sakazakii]EKA9346630.1 siderophore-interacting protein [Cronobacter sakazakii]EKK4042507.1 siderophore-interacting protein [Cronobacter sakazakii]ELL7785852.1 siderophore-interacting protein [Cronobacter sakazakii]ELY2561085.1 siderophore-interacting protein [Cronobacter sakazakii]ELY2754665.1 siderophore-interacting protein [Cronobacter sakazakii]